MKAKFGDKSLLANNSYMDYKKALKVLLEKVVAKQPEKPIDFALIAGKHLPWKDGSKEEHPFLYIGDVKKWKAEIMRSFKDKTTFTLGECMIEKLADKEEYSIKLFADKGKLVAPSNIKAIQKLFATKFKPRLHLEVVKSLDIVEEKNESEADDLGDSHDFEAKDLKVKAKEIIDEVKVLQKSFEWDAGMHTLDKVKKWLVLYKEESRKGHKEFINASHKIHDVGVFIQKHLKLQAQRLVEVEKLIDELEKDPSNTQLPKKIDALFAQLK